MKIPLVQRCCLCTRIREIVDIDSKVLHGQLVGLYYCGECMGVTVATPKPVAKRSATTYLNAEAIKALKETPSSMVLRVVGLGVSAKNDINQDIRDRFGGYLNPTLLGTVLRSLVKEGAIQESTRIGASKHYHLSLRQKIGGAA